MEKENKIQANGKALIPFILFVAVYLGVGIVLNSQGVEMAFYQFPAPTAVLLGLIVAFFMFKGTLDQKFDTFIRGCGDENIIMCIIIYWLAGAFSTVAKEMGAVDSFVNFGLSLVPAQFMTAGIFIVGLIMSMSTGTSMGTIAAIGPIAVGIAERAGLNLPLAMAAVIGAAMFGDNLSVISDTTIAATRSQGCDMKDKFRLNATIAIPAALVAIVLMLIFGAPEVAVAIEVGSYSFIKIVPYFVVLVAAVMGVNVFAVLVGGIILAGAVGIVGGDLTFIGFTQATYNGMAAMTDVSITTMFVGGLAAMVTKDGGLQYLIEKIRTTIKGPKSAELGLVALTAATDLAIANNTVTIIVDGPIAKEIAYEYKVDPRRSASLLDIFAGVVQTALPYGAHLLLIGSLSGGTVNAFQVMPYLWYNMTLGLFGLASIYIPFADGVIKSNPWNWEKGMDQAKADRLEKAAASSVQ